MFLGILHSPEVPFHQLTAAHLVHLSLSYSQNVSGLLFFSKWSRVTLTNVHGNMGILI